MINDRENGADFYGLPRNEGFVELEKEEWTYVSFNFHTNINSVPDSYEFGSSVVVPLKAGENVHWKCHF